MSAHPNFAPQAQLSGHRPRWATASNLSPRAVDLAASLPITLVLRRAPAVQAAFEKLLADQQDPNSPLYHQWLTPQQVGALYGPTQADLDALTGWAKAQGLHLDSISPSHMLLEFSAPAVNVASAFRTNFSYFLLNGEPRLSINLEPSIPAALAPIVAAVDGLSDVPVKPLYRSHSVPAPQGGEPIQPEFTNGSNHYVTPNDFTTIFDIASVYSGGNTGKTIGSKAQHIAIIDESDVVTQDIADYASKVGIASYTLNTIFATGADPGIGSSQGESTLDVMRTISTAPGAISDLIVASGSVYTGASYNVNTLVDPVMTISWGSCEVSGGVSTDSKWDTLFSAGAAEGISIFVSAGDAGAAGCDTHGDVLPPSNQVLSINAICASTYTTCVGGTEFADTANPSLYWATSNGTGLSSALSYIPEGAWNTPTDSSGNSDVEATGGGVSLYIAKPSWQTGTGVPADGYRDNPDISLPSAGHDGYFGCLNLNCESGGFEYFSGTSAAAPGMAGIAALLNTRAGVAQGNLNPLIYRLAASASTNNAFHDTTIASSGVTNCTVTTPSMCNNSVPSPSGLTGGLSGYVLATGYDQLTGWGSPDVAKFLAAAVVVPTVSIVATSPSLSFTSGATSGNTDTVTLTSSGGFAGTVTLGCVITTSSAAFQPMCSISPATPTLTSGSTATATVTISSTVAQVQLNKPALPGSPTRGIGYGSGVVLAMALLFLPVHRRRFWTILAILVMSVAAMSSLTGCSSKPTPTTTTTTTLRSSAGSYTVTVTATSTTAATATTTFALTIN